MNSEKLSQEYLKSIEENSESDSIMQRFLNDSAISIRRIESTSTVKSVYFDSSRSESTPRSQDLDTELNLLKSMSPEGTSHFNLIVLGGSGLGKTSFIRAFARLKFFEFSPIAEGLVPSTTKIEHNYFTMSESEFSLKVDLIDTPGYGIFRDIKGWTSYICRYLKQGLFDFEKTGKEDTLVNLALYFVDGSLKETDVKALKEIQKYVDVIPILAKADVRNIEEIIQAKLLILQHAQLAGILFFDCAKAAHFQKQELLYGSLGVCPPFALISAVSLIQHAGQMIYGRKYPWGFCDINNPAHCDFGLLKSLLISCFAHKAIENSKRRAKAIVKYYGKLKRQKKHKKTTLQIIGSVASLFTIGFLLRK